VHPANLKVGNGWELGKIHLRLFAGSCFEPNLEARYCGRAKVSEKVGDGRVAAVISVILQLA
jgi:hypothetical protein